MSYGKIAMCRVNVFQMKVKSHGQGHLLISKNRSTEGCPKPKSPETRQVQEILVSTLEHLQVPKQDRTRRPEEQASPAGMPHPLQMFHGNLSQLGEKSNSVIRSRSVIGSKIGVMPDQ